MSQPLPRFTPPPHEGDTAAMDQALAEARDDLNRLIDHLRPRATDVGIDLAVSRLVQGLLNDLDWDRLVLASTLGAAVGRLAAPKQPTGGAA